MKMNWNASQKRGALVLLVLLVALTIWRGMDISGMGPVPGRLVVDPDAGKLLNVDLNLADSARLDSVPGIGPTFARRIVRYRELIGGYDDKEQLMNVFGITPEAFIRIEPHVYVDTTHAVYAEMKAGRKQRQNRERREQWRARPSFLAPNSKHVDNSRQGKESSGNSHVQELSATPEGPNQTLDDGLQTSKKLTAPRLTNINTADSSELVRIPGIGPGTAGRIIKYRNRLSYFLTLDQLQEVWGIRPENLERMLPFLTVGNLDAYPKIRINEWDVDHLGRHPYIGFKQAKILVAYREEHGAFQRGEDLRWVAGIDPTLPGKLEGYLEF